MTTRNAFADPIEAPDGNTKILAKDGIDDAGYVTINDLSATILGHDLTIDGTLTADEIRAANAEFQGTDGSTQFQIETTNLAANNWQVTGAITGFGPALAAVGSDTNIDGNIAAKGTGDINFGNGAGTLFVVGDNASGLANANYLTVTPGQAGSGVRITAAGSDTNIRITLAAKGVGDFVFGDTAGQASALIGTHGGNYVHVQGAAAANPPSVTANGNDTNIDFFIAGKGTGVVKFGTHTGSGDAAVSGYITIRDAGGTLRKLAVIT